MKQDELRSGELLGGKYRIIGPLGAGGHATVYHAEQEGLGRQVAIKVLRVRDAMLTDRAEAVLIRRFEQEAKLLSSLRDPHTVTMYDYGRTEGGTLYMVFEYIQGESLERVLMREGAMAPGRVVKIVRQILESLQEAHAMGVLHRDIKPSNIMLYKHVGRADQVKVLDFGIAKLVSEQSADMTAEGSIVGTPRYIAPERLREQEVPASDLYSVGMVAWEMLTGRAVLDGKSGIHALRAQIEQPSISLPAELHVPLGLRQCMNKLMCKPLNQRYATAEQVLLDLERWDQTPGMFGPDDLLSDDVTAIAPMQTPVLGRTSGGHRVPTTREELIKNSPDMARTELDPHIFDVDQTAADLVGIAELTRQDMLARWQAAREQEARAAAAEEATLRGSQPSQPAIDPLRTMPMPVVQEHTLRESSQPTMERQVVQPATRPIGAVEVTIPMNRAPVTAPAIPNSAPPTPRPAPSATEPNVAAHTPAASERTLALSIIAALVLVALVYYATRIM